jgi:hypothetical protein
MTNTNAVFFLILILSSCTTSSSKKTIEKTNRLLPNEKHLLIEKTNESSLLKGIFTGHIYDTIRSYTYKVIIDNDVEWDGGSSEPKHILFCEGEMYLHSLKEKCITTKYYDSTSQKMEAKYNFEIQDVYEKHIDKRYFFKLMGEDFWTEIISEKYLKLKNQCKEYDIPNDNER